MSNINKILEGLSEQYMQQVNEDTQLYKGIFWITDLDNISNNKLYFQIPCDLDGNPLNNNLDLNSKNHDTYNHERTWKQLSSKETHNKPYNYYPRGRVEITGHGHAAIYLNPNINTTEVIDWIKRVFNLNIYNNISKVKVISDGSEHYKCYLDN